MHEMNVTSYKDKTRAMEWSAEHNICVDIFIEETQSVEVKRQMRESR